MVKYTQTIRRQQPTNYFESVWPFSEWNENYPIGNYIYKFKNKNIRLIQT